MNTPPFISSNDYILGIDATNIRMGGGVTHILELLSSYSNSSYNFQKVIIWASSKTLDKIGNYPWLVKINPKSLNGSLIERLIWQFWYLYHEAKKHGCIVLFVPGGFYFGNMSGIKVVTMNQNLLPFEPGILNRSKFSIFSIKMFALRYLQKVSFKKASGVIFLSEYAKNTVLRFTGKIISQTTIIPHGLNPRFSPSLVDLGKPISDYCLSDAFVLLYVSTVEGYKHQIEVLDAVKLLRDRGYPIRIDFIGPGVGSYLRAFKKRLLFLDHKQVWAQYVGPIPYDQLGAYYANANLGIFASSCETFGITLLEKMASGLPIACSNMSCMPEILQDGGLYFNPEDPLSIADAIETYILNPQLRVEKSLRSIELARNYSWEKCAQTTFSFLEKIAREYKK